ncbi:MAG TPA: prepilin-type N-terminal cleavage/methylation domain-containing protein [Candidatus Ozemobacteraceae bacterium]|nr:prepilin-type N-terminal cleavage/methylation domain-containing protein [Candidatus Ozemobacteraceae bacterium]
MNRGMSMIEILVGLVIFSLAMVPLLSFSFTTTRGTHSVGKHMMAGQLAASLMDRLLARPYDEALVQAKELAAKRWMDALDDPLLVSMLDHSALAAHRSDIEQDLRKSFRFFQTNVAVKEGSGDEAGRMFLLTVEVSWRIDDGSEKSRQSLDLKAIKYREDL